jgi:hypothetical protein
MRENKLATVYNKFAWITLSYYFKTSASIYALGFLEAGSSYADFKSNPFALSRSAGVGLRIYACIWTTRIDFGHGFDALPGTSTPNGWETHLLLDNNSSFANRFSNTIKLWENNFISIFGRDYGKLITSRKRELPNRIHRYGSFTKCP